MCNLRADSEAQEMSRYPPGIKLTSEVRYDNADSMSNPPCTCTVEYGIPLRGILRLLLTLNHNGMKT